MSVAQPSVVQNLPTAVGHVAHQTKPSAIRTVEIWGYDPAWWRIEWQDNEGQSLGVVYFERRLTAIDLRLNSAVTTPQRTLLDRLSSWLRDPLRLQQVIHYIKALKTSGEFN